MTNTDQTQGVDVEESKRLNELLVSTRLELQAAHDVLIKAYELMRDGNGPGPSAEEIERVAAAGRKSKDAMAAYSEFLDGISNTACERVKALHAVVTSRRSRF
jgi:hypothetical protein